MRCTGLIKRHTGSIQRALYVGEVVRHLALLNLECPIGFRREVCDGEIRNLSMEREPSINHSHGDFVYNINVYIYIYILPLGEEERSKTIYN